MSNIRQTSKKITIPIAGVIKVFDAPSIEPFTGMYIYASSKGVKYGAGNLAWEVTYGGGWDGKPFESDHIGGVVKGSGNIADSEIAHLVYSDLSMLPANLNQLDPHSSSNMDRPGFPIVLKLTNNKSVPINLYVSFLSSVYYRI